MGGIDIKSTVKYMCSRIGCIHMVNQVPGAFHFFAAFIMDDTIGFA